MRLRNPISAPIHSALHTVFEDRESYPSDLALLWPLKLTDAGVLKSAVGPAPTFTGTPTVDSAGVTPGDGPSFSSVVTWADGGTRVWDITMSTASADLVGDVEVGGGLSVSSAGLSFSDGTNTATVATSWAAGDVVTGVVQVDASQMRVGVYPYKPVTPTGPYTYYVDPSGDDANTGLTTALPFATLAKVESMTLEPGDTVLLKAGAEWVEPLIVKGGGTEAAPVTVGRYGTGDNPKIKGALDVTAWTKTAGRTNVYETPLAFDLLDVSMLHVTAYGTNWWHVWEDRHYLVAAATLAACDSTAGSCFYDSTAGKMYIHATGSGDPATNSKAYRIPVVYAGISTAATGAGNDNAWLVFEDIDVECPGRYFGSAHNKDNTSGSDHVIFRRCVGTDSRHDGWTGLNTTLFDACVAENVRANGGFVFNTPDDTGDFSGIQRAQNCIFRPGPESVDTSQWANGAFHLHHYAGRHGQVQIVDCTVVGGCRAAITTTNTGIIGGDDADSILVDGMTVGTDMGNPIWLQCPTRNITIKDFVMSDGGSLDKCIRFDNSTDHQNLTIQNSVLKGDKAKSEFVVGLHLAGTSGVIIDRVVFDGFYVAVSNSGATGQADADADHCTFVNCNYAINDKATAGDKIKQQNNLFNNNAYHVYAVASTRAPIGDYNGYGSAVTSKFRIGGTNGNLATWKSVIGTDAHSIDTTVTLDADYVIVEGSTALTADSLGGPVGAAN